MVSISSSGRGDGPRVPPSVISPEQSASLMTIRGSSITGGDTDKWVWLMGGVLPGCGHGFGSDHFLTTCNTLLSLTIFLLRIGRCTRVSSTWRGRAGGRGGGERGGGRGEGVTGIITGLTDVHLVSVPVLHNW